jgi:hypothetical protein
MANNPSGSSRFEYGKVPLIMHDQWAFILKKDSKYQSATFTETAHFFGTDLMNFAALVGSFFQEVLKDVRKQTDIPKDIEELPNEILSMDYISPIIMDDVRRVNKMCLLYKKNAKNKNLDKFAIEIRVIKTEIIWLSNTNEIKSIIDEGAFTMMRENPMIDGQGAIDAIWFLSRFIKFCVQYVEMFDI